MSSPEHEHHLPANASSASNALAAGIIVDGKFRIKEFLGKGATCSVYRAEHLGLRKEIALKMLLTPVSDINAIQRFRRECTTLAGLGHPNLVAAYGFGIHGEFPYLAMELLPGNSLAQELAQHGKFDREKFLRTVIPICDGLSYLHENGVVHRDIKPSNIMLLPDGTIKIVDFGLAKITRESERTLQKLTQTGAMVGTALYMSPEQCAGQDLDARSDIYSLGCVMYELLDGNPPFSGDSAMAVIYCRRLRGNAEMWR